MKIEEYRSISENVQVSDIVLAGYQNAIEQIKMELEELHYFENIHVTRAGGVISSHCGPGTLGVLYVAK